MNSSLSYDIFNPSPSKTNRVRTRFGLLWLLLITACAILITRSFYLQIVQGSFFALRADNNRIAVIPQIAARGLIYDSRNNQLVENVASTDLLLDPSLISAEGNEATLLEYLPRLINISPEAIKDALQRARERQDAVVLAKALDHETVIKLSSALNNLPGVRLSSAPVRNYPHSFSTAHVLGYTSSVTEEDLANNNQLLMSEATGKAGLELQYDQLLRGQNGASYLEINAAGHPQKQISAKLPVAGSDLVLTLDLELQQFIYDLMANTKNVGTVIAMDPNDGAVQALVNYPSFNANAFSQPAYHQEAEEILQSPDKPLFNRAIKGTYPPGSTVKPLLAAAALEEKIISADTTIFSTGGIKIGDWNFPDWKAGGHGTTDVYKAIAESVNSFFYLVAGGDATHPGLGITRVNQYLNNFSWGIETGIDLPGEARGLIPSPEWKQQVKQEPWYIGDTYHLGIGQGDLLITPLQLTVAISAIANHGTIHQPYLAATRKNNEKTVVLHKAQDKKLPISDSNLKIVRDGMHQAVINGSARSLLSLPIDIAGKTGTAQTGAEEETHAWFTGFGPFAKPSLVITVLLEKGGKGDTDAIPIAKEIWQWWADHRN